MYVPVNIQPKCFVYEIYSKDYDSKHFVSDSIFERLKFDYSSSETVSNHEVKKDFLGDCAFLEIRLT